MKFFIVFVAIMGVAVAAPYPGVFDSMFSSIGTVSSSVMKSVGSVVEGAVDLAGDVVDKVAHAFSGSRAGPDDTNGVYGRLLKDVGNVIVDSKL